MPISITSAFDGGNISVVTASDPADVQLEIRPEPRTPKDNNVAHYQWFCFRAAGVCGQALTLNILNAGKSSFPEAWPGYQACASYNYEEWFRVKTTYDAEAGVLAIHHTPKAGVVFYSFWAPYPYTRHLALVARMASAHGDLVRHEVLGRSIDGRDIDLLQVGQPGGGKRRVWIIARQHPGETMAEWYVEGLLERLTSKHDPLVDLLLQEAVFYVVPNCNPDGSIRGHLRTNAKGANLNREWAGPTADYSPEVLCILNKMDATGVDFFADVHGDEEYVTNFVAGEEGIPHFSTKLQTLQTTYMQALQQASPDFRPSNLYGVDAPGSADMRIANNAVGERFNCISITIEQPFKDVASHPDRYHGWSPQRAKQFAVAGLQALYATLLKMRELEAAGGGGAGAAGAAAAAEGGKRAAQGTAEGQGPGDKRQRTGVMGGQ